MDWPSPRFASPAGGPPEAQSLQSLLEARLEDELQVIAVPDAAVVFDDHASPWHTLCSVESRDRPGLLSAVTTAFAAAGASVKTARVTADGDNAIDVFELTDRRGAKLSAATQLSIDQLLRRGASPRRGRRRDVGSKDSVQTCTVTERDRETSGGVATKSGPTRATHEGEAGT